MKIKDHFLTGEHFELVSTEIKGVLKTEPVPSQLNRYYQSKEYISHHQDGKSIKQRIYKWAQSFNLNFKRNILAQYLPKNANVLDYGCGVGDFLGFIENDYITYGFEPSLEAQSIASTKLQKTRILAELNEIPNHSLDAITLWHVLEHIENQDDILNEFYNKLKTNGLLILALPNHESYDAQYYKSDWAAYDVPRHLYHYSRQGAITKFNSTKWHLLKIKPLLLDSIYISLLSEKYRKNPFGFFFAPIIGTISNFKALKSGDFSSLVYILEKK